MLWNKEALTPFTALILTVAENQYFAWLTTTNAPGELLLALSTVSVATGQNLETHFPAAASVLSTLDWPASWSPAPEFRAWLVRSKQQSLSLPLRLLRNTKRPPLWHVVHLKGAMRWFCGVKGNAEAKGVGSEVRAASLQCENDKGLWLTEVFGMEKADCSRMRGKSFWRLQGCFDGVHRNNIRTALSRVKRDEITSRWDMTKDKKCF